MWRRQADHDLHLTSAASRCRRSLVAVIGLEHSQLRHHELLLAAAPQAELEDIQQAGSSIIIRKTTTATR